MESITAKPNIIEMAKKKRHIFILEKLQKGVALTKGEIAELEILELGKLKKGYVSTQDELAEVFGVDPRTVRRWIKSGMPKDEEGFNILEIKYWRDSRNEPRGEIFIELTKPELKDQIVFGQRIGIMFFKDRLLHYFKIQKIAALLENKNKAEIEKVINKIVESLSESVLKENSLQLLDNETTEV